MAGRAGQGDHRAHVHFPHQQEGIPRPLQGAPNPTTSLTAVGPYHPSCTPQCGLVRVRCAQARCLSLCVLVLSAGAPGVPAGPVPLQDPAAAQGQAQARRRTRRLPTGTRPTHMTQHTPWSPMQGLYSRLTRTARQPWEAGGIPQAGDVSDTCFPVGVPCWWCECSTWITCGRGCFR